LYSLDILGPLLSDEARSSEAWLSWVAHVNLLSFCLKHEFSRADRDRVEELVQTYLKAFRAVPQYAGWEKPKHHFLLHLRKYLERFGPFRGYWCMPWEVFLQVLKRMFNMTNYKSAPRSVANMWSLKAAFTLESAVPREWYEDVIVPSGELLSSMAAVRAASTTSMLVRVCLQQPDHFGTTAVRMLRSVLRGPAEIKVKCWVLIDDGASLCVGVVDEMAQFSLTCANVIRLWCTHVRPISRSEDHDRMSVRKDAPLSATLVRLESVCLCVLHCVDTGEEYSLRPVV
jgi:hypothetical protein